MRYFLFYMLLMLAFTSAMAQEIDPWNLERCINQALEKNINLKIQQNLAEKAGYNRQESQWKLLPSINGWGNSNLDFRRSTNQNNEISSGASYNMNYGISASLNLFAGFTHMNSIAAYRFNELAVQENSNSSKNTLIVSVIELYSQVVYQKTLIEIAKEQLEISQFESKRIAATIATGQLEAVAQHEINATVSGNQLQLSRAENEYRLLKLQLAQLIELPENTDFNLDFNDFASILPNVFLLSIDQVYTSACQNYPAILEKEFELDYYRKQLHISKGNIAPTINLNGSYGSNFFSTDTLSSGKQTPFGTQFDNYLNPSLGLSLSMPIFNGRTRNFQIKKSRIDLENAIYTLENQKKLIRREIEEALLRLETLNSEYQHATDYLVYAEKSFETYREKYRLGLVNTTDFMSAQNQLAQAKSDRIRAQFSWIVQEKTVRMYQGKP